MYSMTLSKKLDEVYRKYCIKSNREMGEYERKDFFSQWLFDNMDDTVVGLYETFNEILVKSDELVKFKELVKKCATNVKLSNHHNNGSKYDNCTYNALPFRWNGNSIEDLQEQRFVLLMILYLYNKRLMNLTGCGYKKDYKNIKNNNIYYDSIGICICSESLAENIILHSTEEDYIPHGDIIEASLFPIRYYMLNYENQKLSFGEIISLFYRFPKL